MRSYFSVLWSALMLTLISAAGAVPPEHAQAAKPHALIRVGVMRHIAPVAPAATAPAAPTNLRLYNYPSPTSVQLAWASGSANESSFSVERKTDGQPDSAFVPVGSADPVNSVGANVLFTDPTGLDFDTVYAYRVRAVASDGTPSDYSNTATATTAPIRPIGLKVAAVAGSDSKLTLSWTDNANHTLYFQLWRKGPGQTTYQNFANWGNNNYYGGGNPGKGNSFSYTDTGRDVSSAYSYYVVAYNPAGGSDPSDTATGTTNTTQAAPAAPSLGGNAGSSGADGKADPKTTIRVYFYDQSTNESSFTLQRLSNDDPAGSYQTIKTSPGAPSTGTFYDNYDAGLAIDSSYSYRAYASNSAGDSPYSNIGTFATVPVRPIGLSVSAVAGSDSKLTLTWTDNANHTLYFQLWRKGPGQTTYQNFANWGNNNYYGGGNPGKGNSFSYTDTGLTVSSTYSYYVIAYNQGGASDPSDAASATTNTTQTAPVAPSLNGNAGSSGADGKADPKTTIRVYFYDQSTNAATVTLQRLNADAPSSVYTNLPGFPKATTGGSGTFYDNYDTGLSIDTAYSYRAFASNSAGDSPYSNIGIFATVPVRPIGLSVSAVAGSDSKLTLSWTDNANHTLYFQLWRKGPGQTTYQNFANWGNNSYYGGGDPGKGRTFTYTDTGRTVSTAYSYYVVAYNQGGGSDPSDTATGTTNTTQAAPAAPSLGGNAGSSGADGKADPKTTIRVYFYDQSTNAATVTLQRLNADDPSSVYTNFAGYPKAITGGNGTFYDNYDTGLAVDTAYSYRAFASNSAGDSPYSNVGTYATVPVSPISLQAAALSDTKIRLSWTDNANHTLYFQLWRKGPGQTTYQNFANWGNNSYYGGGDPGKGRTFTYTDTGLTVSTAYSYYVIAYNQGGQSDPSNTTTATTYPANAPGAPSDLRAAGGVNPSQININWLDNSLTEYGFIVERKSETETAFTVLPGANPGDPTVGPQPGTGRVYYSDKAVADDTTYTYRVKATNPVGESAYSSSVSATTAPTAVSGLAAAAVAGTNDTIKLTWTSSSKHEDGFNIYRQGPGETAATRRAIVPAAAGPGSAVAYTDSGLSGSAPYSYYVTAYNGAGESAASATVSATTGTVTPTTVTITSPLNGAHFDTGVTIPVTVTATPAAGTTITSYTLIVNDVPTTQTSGSFSLTGLAAGTYTLKAKAVDSAGNTATFPGLTITVSVPKPAAPVLQTAAPGDGQVVLTFTTVANAQTYTLKSSPTPGGPYTTDVSNLTAPAGAATATATDLGLTNGVLRYFVVSAVGVAGESPNSNELSATPTRVSLPPTVTLTSPSDGATLGVPGAVTLTAAATAPSGTVTQVEFFQNGVSVGIVQTAPYTLLVSGLAAGTYVYKAVVTDSTGATATSASATVTVVNTTPGVTILTGPADLATVCANTVVFTWTGYSASTPAGSLRYEVQIDNSGTWSAPTSETSYTLSGLSEGLHSLAIRLLNADGTVEGSPVGRSFFVSLTPPVLLQSTVDARDTRAIVSWSTSKPTTGQIEYGTTTSYGQTSAASTVPDGGHTTTLLGLTTQTTYHYRIRFTDGCHPVVSDDKTFTTQPLLKANLTITGATVPGSFAPLDQIAVSWTVLNSGPGDALNGWTDTVYLSTHNTLDVTATVLGSFPVAGPTLAFTDYTENQTLSVPRVPAGQYYLIIQANSANTLPETLITDNAVAIPVQVTALQDLVVSPSAPAVTVTTHAAVSGTLTLTNLSTGTLSGLTATVKNAPANVTVNVTLPATTLQSLESETVTYTVTASDASVLSSAPEVDITSASGPQAAAILNVTVVPPAPVLSVLPGTLQTSMVRGGQRLVDFTVTNTGDAPAKALTLAVPNVPWLSVTAPPGTGDLAPGATATLELALTPATDLPLGAYTGSLGIRGTNAGVSIPFSFNCVSTNASALKVVAQDEFSFFADTHENVAGAHVVLSDVTTGAIIVDDVTGPDGTLSRAAIPEGNYNVDVTADNHNPYHGQFAVIAGEANEIDPFLSRQLVTYTWTVVPIPFTDTYDVVLQAVFETRVPAPVITVSPLQLDLGALTYDANGKAVVNYTLTNHGFIAAKDTQFNINGQSSYTVTPALTSLGTIAPLSSVIVPVTIINTKLAPHTKLAGRGKVQPHDFASCVNDSMQGIAKWSYDCGGPQTASGSFILYVGGSLAISGCGLVSLFENFGFSGGGGPSGGGGSFGGGGSNVSGPAGILINGPCAPAP